MTCYFRQIQPIFKKIGIEVNNTNKREIDKVIHELAGIPYKNCSATWREVKKRLADDDVVFIYQLKKTLAEKLQP